jgi:hypothetical protein
MTEQKQHLLEELRWLNCMQDIFEALPDANATPRQLLETDPDKLREILARHYGQNRADQMLRQVSR